MIDHVNKHSTFEVIILEVGQNLDKMHKCLMFSF